MKVEELEMRLKALEEDNKSLRARLVKEEDTEEIKRLQRAYGYYLERVMFNEIADLFVDDPGVEMRWVGYGTFIGKEKIRKVWEMLPSRGTPELLHLGIQLSPIITIAPDGRSAKGRWYCLGGGGFPVGERIAATLSIGIYENEYVKQDGKWKIKVLAYNRMFSCKVQGVVPPELELTEMPERNENDDHMQMYPFDIPSDISQAEVEYPSGYIRPFHFMHPVTGKETSEKELNASFKKAKPK
jgi:hypothetical protein